MIRSVERSSMSLVRTRALLASFAFAVSMSTVAKPVDPDVNDLSQNIDPSIKPGE